MGEEKLGFCLDCLEEVPYITKYFRYKKIDILNYKDCLFRETIGVCPKCGGSNILTINHTDDDDFAFSYCLLEEKTGKNNRTDESRIS